MSLVFRKTGARRRLGAIAAVGGLLTYLVLAAVPAGAIITTGSSCNVVPGPNVGRFSVNVVVDVDATVALASLAGGATNEFYFSDDGGVTWNQCGPFGAIPAYTNATTDFINVTSLNLLSSGNETFVLVRPTGGASAVPFPPGVAVLGFSGIRTNVNLGNGSNDRAVFAYDGWGASTPLAPASTYLANGTTFAGFFGHWGVASDPLGNDVLQLGTDLNGDTANIDNANLAAPVGQPAPPVAGDGDADVYMTGVDGVTGNLGGNGPIPTFDIGQGGGSGARNCVDAAMGPAAPIVPVAWWSFGTAGPVNPGVFARPTTMNGGAGTDFLGGGSADDVLNGGPGNDFIDGSYASSPITVDLSAGTSTGGGLGNDTLVTIQHICGSIWSDTLTGDSSDNLIIGLSRSDAITGGLGNDILAGDHYLDGAPFVGPEGNDRFYEGTVTSGADLIAGQGDGGLGTTATGWNGRGDSVIYGDAAGGLRTNAVVVTIGAGGGNDGEGCVVSGGIAPACEGDNVGGDVERLVGGAGNDTFVGDGSDEAFVGNGGNNTFNGGGELGTPSGGAFVLGVWTVGGDVADYSASTDAITADMAARTVTRGTLTDTFTPDAFGTSTIENVIGTNQDDTFLDDSASDVGNAYIGWDGDDTFDQGESAGPSTDDDWMSGGSENEDGDGDTVDYSARTANLGINMGSGALASPSPFVSGEAPEADSVDIDIENLLSGSGDDQIDGNALNNHITAGDGNDEIDGWVGNDTFHEGAAPNGADIFEGDEGADWLDYSQRTGDVRLDLTGGGNQGEIGEGDIVQQCCGLGWEPTFGLENAMTGSGNDIVFGNQANNYLMSGAGDDLLGGGPANLSNPDANDILDAGEGIDTVTYVQNTAGSGVTVDLARETGGGGASGTDTLLGFENARGTSFSDVIRGSEAANILVGLAGNDIIAGRAGDDHIRGGTGADHLNGGAGIDACVGGPGDDVLKKCE